MCRVSREANMVHGQRKDFMYLAIDLGSTQFKTAVFNRKLEEIGRGAHTLKYTYPGKGGVELDPAGLLTALKQAIRQAIKSAGIQPSSLKAIAIDSQAQTFAVFDEKGKPQSPFFSWLDERATETALKMASCKPWTGLS